MKEDFNISCRQDKVGNLYFIVSYENGNGESIVRHLSYVQFQKLLNNCNIEDKTYVSPGRLAEGYIDSVICSDGSGIVRMYVPAQPRVILLGIGNQKLPRAFKIPMPPMLFQIHFGGARFRGNCCIVKGSYEDVRDEYYGQVLTGYQYPFGNVDTDGSICMGNIPYEVQTAFDAPTYISAFFDGITSNHYMSASHIKSGKLQMEFLSVLERREVFPYEELLELSLQANEKLCRPFGVREYGSEIQKTA